MMSCNSYLYIYALIMNKIILIEYIDALLQADKYLKVDASCNWLQVDSECENISQISYAVDCTDYIIDQAVANGSNFLIVHHWLFWWVEQPVLWMHYKKLQKLLKNDIALYCSHLPIDAHEKYGNNWLLMQDFISYFNLEEFDIKRFGLIENTTSIWWSVRFKNPINLDAIAWYCKFIGIIPNIYNYWEQKQVQSLAFVSGKWNIQLISEARKNNIDLFVTGELVHYESTYAKEIQQSVLLWWHYETERCGVRALSEHISTAYNIPIIGIDIGIQ